MEAFRGYAFQELISKTGEKAELDWKEHFWYPAYSKLDPRADLCAESIIQAMQRTKANSYSRQVCCQKMRKLAECANITVDFKPYQGSYNPRNIERTIPKDEEIEAAIDAMKNPQWPWIAAMLATHGLSGRSNLDKLSRTVKSKNVDHSIRTHI